MGSASGGSAGGRASVRSALNEGQWRRKRVLLMGGTASVAVLALLDSHWRHPFPLVYMTIEWLGVALILASIAGRMWCTAYIGGRKKRELVTTGPYSLVRNPLYVFTLIGVAGVGLQFGSVAVAAILCAIAYCVFRSVIDLEESFLADAFPTDFERYSRHTARLWPNFANWRGEETLVMPPRKLFLRTLLDSSLLLTAIPIAEAIEHLQQRDTLPTLVRIF